MIAVGLFVLALTVVGVLLLTSPDRDGENAGLADDATPMVGQSMLTTTATQSTPMPDNPGGGTATPTAVEARSSATTATAPATPTSTGTADPEATATEDTQGTEPADDASPEASPTIASEVEPEIGEFGTLPPAQIVSGGLARSVDLSYELAITLDAVPTSATAYRLYWAGWSAADAESVAANVGIAADVQGSDGDYEVIGDEGQLYISRTVVQYVNSRSPVGGLLEDNATVIENARIWLANSGITAGNVGNGALIGRDDAAQRAVILFKPTSPAPLLAFYPSATVTIGPGGDVREANIRWPDGYDTSNYGMRPADQIWNDVLAGEGSLDADLSQLPGSGPVSGTFTVFDVSVAYSYSVAGDGSEYLVPLIVFSGEIYATEYGASVPASVYIQGVYGQSAPRG
ncbi:MAG TPA: hypothetical protein VMM78_18510 [Thermomicrobiales bacterium]|nr:hypothetical protein [Thermomicrobiales bacterium]